MNTAINQKNLGKKARLEARITSEQKELVVEAARITGRSLTDFVVNTVVEAAKRTIREQQILQLSEKDRLFFVETILNPPQPNEKLKASAQKYRQLNSEVGNQKEQNINY